VLNDMPYDIYLELGNKKVLACAVEWPGWCRSGRDEDSAIETLIAYASRFSDILKSTDLPFVLPQGVSNFSIVERVEGNFSTSFGTPNVPISSDSNPLNDAEIHRFMTILKACWQAFDKTVEAAEGKELRKGPRGGGRELSEIVDHVANAEMGYVRRLGCSAIVAKEEDILKRQLYIHREVLNCIEASALGRFPLEGSQRLKRWPLPYFIRRVAWHVVDHTWEIEDRIIS
jgi:hypothetical protein